MYRCYKTLHEIFWIIKNEKDGSISGLGFNREVQRLG
jgi:hypothetical protein